MALYGLIYNLALPSVQLIQIAPITTAAKKKKNLYLFNFFFSEILSLDISGESSAADDILSFSYFSDKQVDISCEMSAQQMLHMKCQEK